VQRGSLKVIKNRRGERVWRLQWRENGRGRTRILGRYADMSRAEADAERQKILAPLNAKTEVAPTSAVTLRRYVEDEYLTLKTRIWKASTRATTEQIVEAHILSELGSRPLASITRKELQALLDAKAESSLSFSVVGHVRWQLAAIFGMAKSDGLTSVNPAEELVIPKCKEPGEKRTIAADSIGKAEMVLAIRERLVFHFAVYQGMRPGEIVGLQLGDFRDGMIHVARRIYRTVVDTPKSWRSRRAIPLMDRTARLLKQWQELLTDQRQEAWLFPSEAGSTPLSYSNLYRRNIQPALAKVGLGKVNFQVLRRTWVTQFSAAEKDPAVRAQLAGHSVDVHLNEYLQPQAEVSRRAMRKLEKRLQ
jgi:integrase